MLLFSINVFGQVRNFNEISTDILSRLNKMGLDSSSLLNDAESAYFNELFKDSLNVFNFVGKKVGFILSGTRSNKSEYFKEEKDRFNRNYTPNKGTLYIFDKKHGTRKYPRQKISEELSCIFKIGNAYTNLYIISRF